MSKRDSLARRKPTKDRLPTFLIVCKGDVTERGYLNDLRCDLKNPIKLVFDPGGDPRTLVRKAVQQKRAKGSDFDQIWVVCDVDDHPHLKEAKQQARDNNVELAISNPCFELWALLHFQEQNAYIKREGLRQLCQTHMPGYDKSLPFEKLRPGRSNAFQRATQLRLRHERNSTQGENPSTDVDLLVQAIAAAANRSLPPGSNAGTTLVR